jgi:hypothetical protein
MATQASVDEHPTCCPLCSSAFEYRLDAAEGGGLRYDVLCTSCDDVYFTMSTPPFASPTLEMPKAA